jgi:Phage integrase family
MQKDCPQNSRSTASDQREGSIAMAQPHLRLVAPSIQNRTVIPKRAKNAELRTREYLTLHEVDALVTAAKRNRYGHRNATMILLAFRHGLRASELVDLRWDQVDFCTCFATPVGSRWLMQATIQERCKPTLAIRTFSIRCATPNWPQIVSKSFGDRKSSCRNASKQDV